MVHNPDSEKKTIYEEESITAILFRLHNDNCLKVKEALYHSTMLSEMTNCDTKIPLQNRVGKMVLFKS